MNSDFIWAPAPVASLPLHHSAQRVPVRRIFCVGRNYHAHAAEMGRPVDKNQARPFYFTKSPDALVESGATVAYPPQTHDYQYEMELVVVMGRPGFEVTEAQAGGLIYGYCCGLDMTRRDLQLQAREQGRPWDLGKDFEKSAVCSEVVPMPGVVLQQGDIALEVNGTLRQQADLSQLIWNVPELIADLSRFYALQAGDLIYTGTPAGVGPVVAGDELSGRVAGVGSIHLKIAA